MINDGRTDRSAAIVEEYQRTRPWLRLYRNAKNRGPGFNTKVAISLAGKDYLFSQTVDWSYDIGKLRIFLELLKHFDAVQGVRPVPIRLMSYIPVLRSIYRVQRRSDNIQKALISLGNYYALRILFGVRFHDFQNVTFYSTRRAQELQLVGRTSFVNPEMLLKSYYGGTRFIEVPIRFIPRTQGDPKGTKLKTVLRSVLDTARNWIGWGARLRWLGRALRRRRIFRVAEPFRLDQGVLRLILPLFEDYS